MRLWLKKKSEVSLREQLVTQIILGIVSDDLKAGQRLPSTRELARRYRIHANTVSSAYRELARRSWVDFRKGSGVYVRTRGRELDRTDSELDVIISKLFRTARDAGYTLAEVHLGIQRWLSVQPPDHFLLIEADPELQAILVAEIEAASQTKVSGISSDSCSDPGCLTGALPLALYGRAERVRQLLPPDLELIVLRSRSVVESLRGQKHPASDVLVTVVSRWPDFLRWARAMLVAAGLDEDSLSFVDAKVPGWKRALKATSLVITDRLTASQLPEKSNVRIFQILSDVSLEQLANFARQLGMATKRDSS